MILIDNIDVQCNGCGSREDIKSINVGRKDCFGGFSLCRKCREGLVHAFIEIEGMWVPVDDEKKPTLYQCVWSAIQSSDGEIRVTLLKYRGELGKSQWMYLWNRVCRENVVAWMPIVPPKPPLRD